MWPSRTMMTSGGMWLLVSSALVLASFFLILMIVLHGIGVG